MGGQREYVPRHAYARAEVSARHAARATAGEWAMSGPRPGVLDAELAQLDDLGWLVNDRAAAERILRLIGALAALNEAHGFDEQGRCTRCRPARWWRQRRHACTVREALAELGIGRDQTGVSTQ
jgi:hypothetical protein